MLKRKEDKSIFYGLLAKKEVIMEKIKIKGLLMSTIKENKKLENKKRVILNKHTGYLELPNFIRRQLREIECQKEINIIRLKKEIRNVF